MVGELRLDVVSGVAKHERGTTFARGEGGDLFVFGPDKGAFCVAEHRQVDRAGDVVLGIF